MKKIIVYTVMASFLLSGCFISNIFRKKDKYGCPSDGRNVGAEKILAGEKAKKAKYKGGRKAVGE
jgi:hypothetical protein